MRFNFIKSINYNNQDIYCKFDLNEDEVKKEYIQIKKKSKRIIELLSKHDEGLSKNKLSSELSMHPNTIAKYIDLLMENKLISSIKSRNKTIYFVD